MQFENLILYNIVSTNLSRRLPPWQRFRTSGCELPISLDYSREGMTKGAKLG